MSVRLVERVVFFSFPKPTILVRDSQDGPNIFKPYTVYGVLLLNRLFQRSPNPQNAVSETLERLEHQNAPRQITIAYRKYICI